MKGGGFPVRVPAGMVPEHSTGVCRHVLSGMFPGLGGRAGCLSRGMQTLSPEGVRRRCCGFPGGRRAGRESCRWILRRVPAGCWIQVGGKLRMLPASVKSMSAGFLLPSMGGGRFFDVSRRSPCSRRSRAGGWWRGNRSRCGVARGQACPFPG